MLEQLLMVEQAHKQALYKLEDEKRNHGDFMKKSDEFTNLLEQERERSVLQTNERGGRQILRHAGRRSPHAVHVGCLCRDLVTCDLNQLQKFSFWFQGKVSMSHSLTNFGCPSHALKQTGCTVKETETPSPRKQSQGGLGVEFAGVVVLLQPATYSQGQVVTEQQTLFFMNSANISSVFQKYCRALKYLDN